MKRQRSPAKPHKVNLLGTKETSQLSWPVLRDAIKAEQARGGDRAALRAVVIAEADRLITPKSPVLEALSDLAIRFLVPVVFALVDLVVDAAVADAR